jgi:hypothetical protein
MEDTMKRLSLFLKFVFLVLSMALIFVGCASLMRGGIKQASQTSSTPAREPIVAEEDVRGIYSGRMPIRGRPANEGVPIRLVFGESVYLQVDGGKRVELTRAGREDESFVFSVSPGVVIAREEVSQVIVEPKMRPWNRRDAEGPIYRNELRLWTERENGTRNMAELDKARQWADLRGVQSQFAFQFVYENWRTRSGGAPFDADRFANVVERLRSDGWRCAEHETLTVSPGRSTVRLFEQDRSSAQLYVIRAEEGAEHLEVTVMSRTGSKNPMDNSMSSLLLRAPHEYFQLDYPVISVAPRKLYRPRPEFQLSLVPRDLDSALRTGRGIEPIRVDIVRFDRRKESGDRTCGVGTWH